MLFFRVSFLSLVFVGSIVALPLEARNNDRPAICFPDGQDHNKRSFDYGTEAVKLGCTGVTFEDGIIKVYYGNNVKEHAAHVVYHYAVYPDHDKAWDLGEPGKGHRGTALGGIKDEGDGSHALDEKMPSSFDHDNKVTVCKLNGDESQTESGLLIQARTASQRNGDCKVQLFDNRENKEHFQTVLAGKVVREGDRDFKDVHETPGPNGPVPDSAGTTAGTSSKTSTSSKKGNSSKKGSTSKKPKKPKVLKGKVNKHGLSRTGGKGSGKKNS